HPDSHLSFNSHFCKDSLSLLAPSPRAYPAIMDKTDLLGVTIEGKYQITDRLGQGGMGVVYKARHLALDTLFAIKVLLKPRSEEDGDRFVQEARLASKVQHPNTVFVSDFGVLPSGQSFLAMEFLRGKTLTDELGKAPLDPLRVCRIGMQIARGMQAVHE